VIRSDRLESFFLRRRADDGIEHVIGMLRDGAPLHYDWTDYEAVFVSHVLLLKVV
jgi:hypothetical protein